MSEQFDHKLVSGAVAIKLRLERVAKHRKGLESDLARLRARMNASERMEYHKRVIT